MALLAEKCNFTLISSKVKLSSKKLLNNVEVVKGHPPTHTHNGLGHLHRQDVLRQLTLYLQDRQLSGTPTVLAMKYLVTQSQE